MRQKAAEPAEPSILDQLALRPEQRAIVDELLGAVRRDLGLYDRCRRELLDEIVVEVRKGVFDRKKLAPLIERTIAEYERATPQVIHFANQIHRTLTPEQRNELVKLWDDDDDDLSEEERRAKEEEGLTRVLDLTGSQRRGCFRRSLGSTSSTMGRLVTSRNPGKRPRRRS